MIRGSKDMKKLNVNLCTLLSLVTASGIALGAINAAAQNSAAAQNIAQPWMNPQLSPKSAPISSSSR